MKTVAKVFIIIDFVSSIIAVGFSLLLWLVSNNLPSIDTLFGAAPTTSYAVFCLIYGLYGIGISIGCFISIHGINKGPVIVMGILNIPVSLLCSIFMFCIKDVDLF